MVLDVLDSGWLTTGPRASEFEAPLHLHPYYQRRGWRAEDFPIASREFQRVISLPLWPGMTSTDVERVVGALGGILSATRRKGAA